MNINELASPTRYDLMLNENDLHDAKFLFELTYYNSQNYFRLDKSAYVPGICQYAFIYSYLISEKNKNRKKVEA